MCIIIYLDIGTSYYININNIELRAMSIVISYTFSNSNIVAIYVLYIYIKFENMNTIIIFL